MNELRHIDLHFAPTNFDGRQAWEAYAGWLRTHMRVSLALAPQPSRCSLNAEIFGLWSGDGYTCQKVCFESLPGFYVTGNLYRPLAGPGKMPDGPGKKPAVLCPHGHWPDGRLHDRDPRGSVVARCLQLARMGAVVFSHDMVGYNDSHQIAHRTFQTDVHFGMSMMALQTWNSIRAIDFLTTLPDVDVTRIAVTGASGGGTQTYTLGAVDDRVSVSAPICMVSYQMQGGCICENAPLLRIDATSVDIARLFAPKPMFVGSCTGDWTKDTLTDELPALGAIYELYDARDQLGNHHVDDGHNYNQEMREHVYGFFNRFLYQSPSADPIAEASVERPPHRDRMVWWGREAPRALGHDAFRRLWRAHLANAQEPHLRDASTVRRALGPLLPHALGVTPTSIEQTAMAQSRAGFSSIMVERQGSTLKVGEATALQYPEGADGFYAAYNRTPFADRVHEILGILRTIAVPVTVHGQGKAGPAALVAAALAKNVTSVKADMCGFDPTQDAAWKEYMDTPSIRQVGGLATVFALIGDRPMLLSSATAAVRALQQRYAC